MISFLLSKEETWLKKEIARNQNESVCDAITSFCLTAFTTESARTAGNPTTTSAFTLSPQIQHLLQSKAGLKPEATLPNSPLGSFFLFNNI
jgi:hypothetical protein